MSNDKKDAKPEVKQETPAHAVGQLSQETILQLAQAFAQGQALAQIQVARDNQARKEQLEKDFVETRERCSECMQLKIACRGEHEELAVWPPSNMYVDAFDGVVVNGVRYKSDSMHHKLKVPAKNNIAAQLSDYVVNEKRTREGAKRNVRDAVVVNSGW